MNFFPLRRSLCAALLSLLIPGTAVAQEALFGVTLDSHQLVRIDPDSGAGTLVGPLDNPMSALGLASFDGGLYALDQRQDFLRRLDPATGRTLASFALGLDASGEGGITFAADGTLFMAHRPVLGQPIQLQRFAFDGITLTPGAAVDLPLPFDGLALDDKGRLFGLRQFSANNSNDLYRINPTTGAADLVAASGIGRDAVAGLTVGGNGVLYAAAGATPVTTSALYTLDPATGAATLVGSTGFPRVSGLAALTIPEPTTLAAVLVVLATVPTRRRGRRPQRPKQAA